MSENTPTPPPLPPESAAAPAQVPASTPPPPPLAPPLPPPPIQAQVQAAPAAPTKPPEALAYDKLMASRPRLETELAKVIVGQREVIDQILIALFAGGHCLITGAPGLAKTLLVKSIAQVFHLRFQRIQFTPDLMPADITGTEILQTDGNGRRMEFVPGPIFTNLLLADEINRTPPKTQAALLEAMQEHQVTAAGRRHPLQEPFFVLATQNPIEMEGTYPLPEAQRDRFMARISMGYPDATAELEMLKTRETSSPLTALEPVVSGVDLQRMIGSTRAVFTSRAIEQYAVAICQATRSDRELRLGASPRATLQLVRAAKARAALDGREFVLPDDIDALAIPVLGHRLIAARRAGGGTSALSGGSVADIILRIVAQTPVPLSAS